VFVFCGIVEGKLGGRLVTGSASPQQVGGPGCVPYASPFQSSEVRCPSAYWGHLFSGHGLAGREIERWLRLVLMREVRKEVLI
jgi:hypothetical protein